MSTETVGLLGTGAQDGHLDFHTAPELCSVDRSNARSRSSNLRQKGTSATYARYFKYQQNNRTKSRNGNIFKLAPFSSLCFRYPLNRQNRLLPSRGNSIAICNASMVECCFTSTETVGWWGTGTQEGHLDFHTAPELCRIGRSNARLNR